MLVAKLAPDFVQKAVMPDGSFRQIRLSDYKGKKVVLFFYPLDFTFVCPTELLAFDHRLGEFQKRGVQVLGCSIDSEYCHLAWRNTEPNSGGIGNVGYPLIADVDKSVARAYDVLADAEEVAVTSNGEQKIITVGGRVALRGSFLIDEEGIVRHAVINDLPLGRNIDEMLRMVDALTFNQQHGEVCPAGWEEGDDGFTETADSVAKYLSRHGEEL